MQEITLKLTIEETNIILEGLGNMPFKTVFGLIGKIQSQAAAQLQPNQAAIPKNEVPANIKIEPKE